MFVVSLTSKKVKKIAVLSVAVCVAVFVVLLAVSKGYFSGDSEVSANSSKKVQTEQKQLDFIASFGWQTDKEPEEVREVVIPEEFDDVYTNYNEIQLSQGYDLRDYAGRCVKRWTYIIRNYPGTASDDDSVRINILVCDGCVIGGDVCCVKLDGFMHGFKKENYETGKT